MRGRHYSSVYPDYKINSVEVNTNPEPGLGPTGGKFAGLRSEAYVPGILRSEKGLAPVWIGWISNIRIHEIDFLAIDGEIIGAYNCKSSIETIRWAENLRDDVISSTRGCGVVRSGGGIRRAFFH